MTWSPDPPTERKNTLMEVVLLPPCISGYVCALPCLGRVMVLVLLDTTISTFAKYAILRTYHCAHYHAAGVASPSQQGGAIPRTLVGAQKTKSIIVSVPEILYFVLEKQFPAISSQKPSYNPHQEGNGGNHQDDTEFVWTLLRRLS